MTCAGTSIAIVPRLEGCAEALTDCAAAEVLLATDVDEVAIMLDLELEVAIILLVMLPEVALDAI